MWNFLKAVFKWVANLFISAVKWALGNPITAMVVGTVLIVAGAWLGTQSWAGAELVGNLVATLGEYLFVAGLGAYLGGQLLGGILAGLELKATFTGEEGIGHQIGRAFGTRWGVTESP